MLNTEQPVITPEALKQAECGNNYACLKDRNSCTVEKFVHKDIDLLQCLQEGPCKHRARFEKKSICNCPVVKEIHKLN